MPADRHVTPRVDPGLRGLLLHGLTGVAIGWAVLGGLIATDAVGLRTLLAQVDGGWIALLVLAVQFGAGFATFAVATALALNAFADPRGRSRAMPSSPLTLQPSRAKSSRR